MFLDKLNHYYLLNDTHTKNGPKKTLTQMIQALSKLELFRDSKPVYWKSFPCPLCGDSHDRTGKTLIIIQKSALLV